jgi:hypothetical protein
MQGICKELVEKIDETQVDLQPMRTLSICKLETVTYTREHLYGQLGLIIQGKAQMIKTLVDTTWQELKAKIAEVVAQANCRRGAGTSFGEVKPLKFDRTTSWTLLRHQF